MKDWWLRLGTRERGLVFVAAVLLFASLYYWGIWKPLMTEFQHQDARQQVLLEQLVWMRGAASEVEKFRAIDNQLGTSGSLLSTVDRAARANNVRKAIKQINPEGDNLVRVVLQPMSFERLMKMLGWLQEREVRVRELTLNRQNQAGQVAGRLALFRG